MYGRYLAPRIMTGTYINTSSIPMLGVGTTALSAAVHVQSRSGVMGVRDLVPFSMGAPISVLRRGENLPS